MEKLKKWYDKTLRSAAVEKSSVEKLESHFRKPREEEIERLKNFIESEEEFCKNFVTIPFASNKIRLWKPLLIQSNVKGLDSISSLDSFSENDYNIDEEVLTMLLLGLRHKVPVEKVCDYFSFFKSLGLRRNMIEILSVVQEFHDKELEKNYNETTNILYQIFYKCVYSSENEQLIGFLESRKEELRMILSKEPILFKTSLCLLVFTLLKNIYSTKPDIFPIEDEKFLEFINLASSVQKLEDHPDLTNIDLTDKDYYPNHFRNLFQSISPEPNEEEEEEEEEEESVETSLSKHLTDITLKTEDGGYFQARGEG